MDNNKNKKDDGLIGGIILIAIGIIAFSDRSGDGIPD